MYHAIVRSRVRALWRRVGAGDFSAAVELASPDIHFHFMGATPISADFRGRDEFAAWFTRLYERFPGLAMRLTYLSVSGWPWDTTVVVRLDVTATLADGSAYANHAIQWVQLRWGQMTSDLVLEDTELLAAACAIQDAARP